LDCAIADYQIRALDEWGHVAETFELHQQMDGHALATARLLLLPGERGEVWNGRRLVGEIRPREQAL